MEKTCSNWEDNLDSIIACLYEFLKWNHNAWQRNTVEQIKNFAITESMFRESEKQTNKDLPFVDVLQGQTRFTDIEGSIEEIGKTD